MFDSLKKIAIICFKGSVDLIVGTTTAALLGGLFPPFEKDESLPRLLTEVFLQTSGTLLVGIESRSLFFTEDDTMGPPYGIAFMASLFIQPGYWEKIASIQQKITAEVFKSTNPSST